MKRREAPADAIVLPGVWAALEQTKTLISRSVQSLSAADPGYFGPGSVSWRIFSHASYGISGVAAVLMQALHPVAMAAVDRHSAFRTDAWRRAHLTADYVFTITFSSRAVADAAAERVRTIHRTVSGSDPQTGRVHRADEPALLLWVHVVHTLFALRGYERFVRRLPDLEADRFVTEQVIAAELVGLDRRLVPKTRRELETHMSGVEGLGVTEPARRFAGMLMRARMPVTMRPFWALHILGAAALIPPEVCRAYGFPRWLPRGGVSRALASAAIGAINYGYLLFRPVRQARARMKQVGRALRANGKKSDPRGRRFRKAFIVGYPLKSAPLAEDLGCLVGPGAAIGVRHPLRALQITAPDRGEEDRLENRRPHIPEDRRQVDAGDQRDDHQLDDRPANRDDPDTGNDEPHSRPVADVDEAPGEEPYAGQGHSQQGPYGGLDRRPGLAICERD